MNAVSPWTDRVWRFRIAQEATIPAAALPVMSMEDHARCLACLAGDGEPIDAERIRLTRSDLPAPVTLNVSTWEWRCDGGHAEGRGLLELALWLTGQSIWAVVALLGLICRPRPIGLMRGP